MIARISKVGGLVKVFAILFEYLSNNLVNNADFEELSDELVANGDFEEIGPELITNGDFEELGAELIANGDFEDDITGWTFTDSNGKVGNYYGREGACRIDFTNSSTIYAWQNSILTSGKSYKVTLDYYIPSGNATVDYMDVKLGSTATPSLIPSLNVLDAWTSVTLYGTADDVGFYLYQVNGTVGDKVYIDNVSVKQTDPNSDWGFSNDATISGGKGNLDGTNSTALFWQDILTDTKTYEATLTVSNHNGAGQNRVMNNSGTTIQDIPGDGAYAFTFTHSDALGYLLIQSRYGGSFSVDNVSVKQVDPNDEWVDVIGTIIDNGQVEFFDNADSLFRPQTFTAGKTYKFVFEGSGDIAYRTGFQGSDGNRQEITLPYTTHLLATGDSNRMQIFGSTPNSAATLTSVSIQEVDPNDEWTIEAVWTIENGVAKGNGASGSAQELIQSILTANKVYSVSFEVVDYVSGSFQVMASDSGSISSNGVYTVTLTNAASTDFRFRPSLFNGSITNVSVQEVQEEDLNTDTTYIAGKDLSLKFKAGNAIIAGEFLEKAISVPVENVQDDAGDPVGDETAIVNYIDSLT